MMEGSKDPLVLSIDCGTQSLRTLIFNQHGQLLAKVKEEYEPYTSYGPGVCEKDPELYWKSTVNCCKELWLQEPDLMHRIVAVTVTAMRNTGVFMDKDNQVFRPSLLWLDQREATCNKKISPHFRAVFKVIGMSPAINSTRKQCKINWIKENEPKTWDKTAFYLQVGGFFHYKLLGKIVDSVSNQIGHLPIDYKRQEWVKNKWMYQWEVFPVEANKLPPLVKSGTILGVLSEKAAEELGFSSGEKNILNNNEYSSRIKIIAGGSDKSCETLGVGCLSEASVSISFGTTATIQTTTKRYLEPIRFMPSYPSVMRDAFNPEIQVFRGYWMIRWFKQEFGMRERELAKELGILPEQLLDELLYEIPPGSDGLMLQPLWKPDLKNPEGKGSIIGFSDIHTRSHIYRAIIEGINFSLIEGLKRIERVTKTKVKKIFVSGGGSQSDAICQITADMFGVPVYRGETYEASGLGAAINAFVGLKIYTSYEEACEKMIRTADHFEPDMTKHHLYLKIYHKIYRKIYPRLKKLYHAMDRIEKQE